MVLYIVLPLFLFLWVQFKFLPYQDAQITRLHLALVVADLGLLWLVWPRLNQARSGWGPGLKALLSSSYPGCLALVCAAYFTPYVVFASFLLWFDQRPSALTWFEP